MDETQEDDSNGVSTETNQAGPTEDALDSLLSVELSSSQLEPVTEALPEFEHEAKTGSKAHSEYQPEPEAETLPQTERNKDENGTAGQPFSIDDDTAGENNGTTAPSAQPDAQAQASTAPRHQPQASSNGPFPPDTVTDGRVRKNPVPNTYIAKVTERDGNFDVMQMGHGRASMDARDLAAKRSSEATQTAAEEAVRNGQNGMARREHVWKPTDPNMTAPPPPDRPQEHVRAPVGPPPKDVKDEQARLLTFLRSLHPVIVVDQLCKALAYFGGIPGAPAPQDPNAFPKSAKGNGSGGAMVSWVAEIFPPADFTKPPFTNFPHNLPSMGYIGPGGQAPGPAYDPNGSKKNQPSDPSAPVKRPRGRPKGSKNSKFRKDKGAKKLKPGDVPPHADGTPWRPGDGGATVDLTQDTNSSQPAQPPDNAASSPTAAQPPTDTTPAKASQADLDSSVAATPGSRKRGRPKGSKTRAKAIPVPNLPRSTEAVHSAPGPPGSPLASVARATNDATTTQYHSPYKAAPAQRKPSAQETTLSQHAQGWVDPPVPSLIEPALDPVPEPLPQRTPPSRVAAAENSSKAKNLKRRKQQLHAPLALPTPLFREPPVPVQPEQLPQQDQSERRQLPEQTEASQAKRRRTVNGARPTSAASNTNSQSQTPVLSTSIASNSVTSTSTSARFGAHGVIGRAPAKRPSPGQMPQQHYQPPPQQQQYQKSGQGQSPTLSCAPQINSSYPQQPQQGYYAQGQQQQYTQPGYQNSLGGTSSANSNQQFSYDNDYTGQTPYALSARRAVEDGSNFGNQSMYDQFGRR